MSVIMKIQDGVFSVYIYGAALMLFQLYDDVLCEESFCVLCTMCCVCIPLNFTELQYYCHLVLLVPQ
jgi:hypothetical protein